MVVAPALNVSAKEVTVPSPVAVNAVRVVKKVAPLLTVHVTVDAFELGRVATLPSPPKNLTLRRDELAESDGCTRSVVAAVGLPVISVSALKFLASDARKAAVWA